MVHMLRQVAAGAGVGRPAGTATLLFTRLLLAPCYAPHLPAGAEPSTPMGGEGGVPPAPHLPWIPTLADLHMLDASVLSRY